MNNITIVDYHMEPDDELKATLLALRCMVKRNMGSTPKRTKILRRGYQQQINQIVRILAHRKVTS